MGVHFYALAAEVDPVCRACAQETVHNIVHVDAVEHIQARHVEEATISWYHLGRWLTMPGQ